MGTVGLGIRRRGCHMSRSVGLCVRTTPRDWSGQRPRRDLVGRGAVSAHVRWAPAGHTGTVSGPCAPGLQQLLWPLHLGSVGLFHIDTQAAAEWKTLVFPFPPPGPGPGAHSAWGSTRVSAGAGWPASPSESLLSEFQMLSSGPVTCCVAAWAVALSPRRGASSPSTHFGAGFAHPFHPHS